MLETTNSVFDDALFDLIKPQSLLAWHRVRLANMLASTGEDWYHVAREYNSGTYNNQYMLIDYKLFTPGQPLLPGTLYVCEQIPGTFVGGDVTRELERGYFPSYNIPYWIEIYNKSGYPAVVDKHGPNNSYQLYSRARIFRRDNHLVDDDDSFKYMIRYNKYESDPYSAMDPMETICSRSDLTSNSPLFGNDAGPSGCIDGKFTNDKHFARGNSWAISGPTTQGGLYPPFDWRNHPHAVRDGEPDVYNFDWQFMEAGWKAKQQTPNAQTATA